MNLRKNLPEPDAKFKAGTRVLYIPYHANNDHNHKDCEKGIVVRKSCDRGVTIFVRFETYAWEGIPDIYNRTPQGCNIDQLITKAEYERRCSSKCQL